MPKEWYKSKAIWGGLIAVGSAIAGACGVIISADTQDQIAELAVVAASAVGGLLAIYGRVKAEQNIK